MITHKSITTLISAVILHILVMPASYSSFQKDIDDLSHDSTEIIIYMDVPSGIFFENEKIFEYELKAYKLTYTAEYEPDHPKVTFCNVSGKMLSNTVTISSQIFSRPPPSHLA